MEQKKNNKGFSLVELIVVIAIMVVLVAVLAPVFTQYVEQSRRATDVQNANSIASSVLIDAADGTTKFTSDPAKLTDDNLPSSIKAVPKVKATGKWQGADFYVSYNESDNTASVYIGNSAEDLTGDLTDEEAATAFKDKKNED